MIGTTGSPHLSCKAGESHGLAQFVAYMLENHRLDFQSLALGDAQKAQWLGVAAQAAVNLNTVFQTGARFLTRAQVQTALGFYCRFLVFFQRGGGSPDAKVPFHVAPTHAKRREGQPEKLQHL